LIVSRQRKTRICFVFKKTKLIIYESITYLNLLSNLEKITESEIQNTIASQVRISIIDFYYKGVYTVNKADGQLNVFRITTQPYFSISDLALANNICQREFKFIGDVVPFAEYKLVLADNYNINNLNIQVGDIVDLDLDSSDCPANTAPDRIYCEINQIIGQTLYFRVTQWCNTSDNNINNRSKIDLSLSDCNALSIARFYKQEYDSYNLETIDKWITNEGLGNESAPYNNYLLERGCIINFTEKNNYFNYNFILVQVTNISKFGGILHVKKYNESDNSIIAFIELAFLQL